MSWFRDTEIIEKWMRELELIAYDLGANDLVIDSTRKLLTKAVDEGMAGSARSGVYVALSCLYLGCRMNSQGLELPKLLNSPFARGLDPVRVADTVAALQMRFSIRLCPKCNLQYPSTTKFCTSCGSWIPISVVTRKERGD
jgi:hypothetical protein